MILNFLKRIVPKQVSLRYKNFSIKAGAVENDESKTVKKGFSIIELLIVLAIGAGIIVVALGYRKFINTSREGSTNQKMATLDTVLEMYRTRIGSYPIDLNELIEGPTNPALRKRWGEALADEKDLQDAWFKEFIYEGDPKGNKYELYSTGSKGESKLLSPASQEI
jgi:prepilin-type N-terminal cleavage/methylation domain-containing protein